MDKKEVESLKQKLFNKKENGWNIKSQEEKQAIFNYAKGYIDYMNKSKTEREIVENSKNIAKQKGFKDIAEYDTLKAGDKVYWDNRGKSPIYTRKKWSYCLLSRRLC